MVAFKDELIKDKLIKELYVLHEESPRMLPGGEERIKNKNKNKNKN